MQGWGQCNGGSLSPMAFCMIPISLSCGKQMADDVMLGGICVCQQPISTKKEKVLPVSA